ncbi:MAG: MATE family efflux transporter, partial [Firmicutes bacterium]|nr:MATE family efflux transporter [Bacillota bacterium]
FYFFFGNLGLLLFMNDSSGDAMQVGVAFLRIVSPFYFVIATKQMADSTLRGTGLMGRFMVSTFTDLSLRVVLAIVLSSLMSSSTGIWLSWPIGWIVSTAMSLVFYFAAPWRRKMKNDKSEIKV